ARLAEVGEELTRAVRNQPDASASRHSALRDRLRLHIDGRAALRDRSWWFRVRRALGTLPFIQRLAAVAVLLVLSVNIVGRYISTIQHSISVEMEAGALPIHAVTPGAVGPVNLDALCTGRDVERPPISAAVRDVVLREYRMERVAAREYELDYLITPELG